MAGSLFNFPLFSLRESTWLAPFFTFTCFVWEKAHGRLPSKFRCLKVAGSDFLKVSVREKAWEKVAGWTSLQKQQLLDHHWMPSTFFAATIATLWRKKINIVRECPDIITTREAHAEFSHEQPIDWRPSSCWSKHCKSGFLRCYNCNLRLTTFASDTTQHQTCNNLIKKWFSAEIVSSFPFISEVGIYREHSYSMRGVFW